MTISRKAKIGFGIAAVGVTGLFVGVLSAASSRGPKSRGALPGPPLDDEDDDDDDDDGAPLPPPSSVEIPTGTMPPTFPIGDGDDLGDVLAPDGPIFSNLPPIVRPQPQPRQQPRPRQQPQPREQPRPIDPPPQVVVVTPPQAPQLPTLPGILPPIAPPVGTPQPAPAPVLNPATQAAAAMVLELLAAQKQRGWKREYDSVREWQSLAGRKVDGKFGPGDALTIAQDFGNIPVVRYWPAASGANPKKALADYRGALEMMAKSKGATQASELRQSAQREKGQSFGPPVGTGGKGVIL